jgi:nucleoside-diphosphate-sugar epimerase
MRIAVTGATGFIGQALLPRLLAEGHQVVALVRDPKRAKLPREVTVIQGDLAEVQALAALCQGVDVVLHVAGAIAGLTRADYFRANVDGTLNVAKAAVAGNVKRFVYVSSLAAREPLLAHYGASKHAAELTLKDVASGMQLTILRPAAVYGPGDKATLPLLKALMSRNAFIPGSNAARFAMVHVSDVARSLLQVARTTREGIFAVDDGAAAHSWAELIDITRAAFGLPLRHHFIPRSLASTLGFLGDGIGRLQGKPWLVNSGQIGQIYHLDWSVQDMRWPLQDPVPLHQGLPDTIRWYQAQGLLPQSAKPHTRPLQKDTRV